MDIIDMQSYDAGYASGLVEGISNGYEIGYNLCMRQSRKEKEREKQRQLYFLKQKLVGVFLLLLSLVVILLPGTDIGIVFLTVPVGIGLIVSRRRRLNIREKGADANNEHRLYL